MSTAADIKPEATATTDAAPPQPAPALAAAPGEPSETTGVTEPAAPQPAEAPAEASSSKAPADEGEQKGLCEKCITGVVMTGTPAGQKTHNSAAGFDVYTALPPPKEVAEGDKDKTGKKPVIVLGPDVFGLGIPNSMLVADRLAKETGYRVVIPDYFFGKPFSCGDSLLKNEPSDKIGFFTKVAFMSKLVPFFLVNLPTGKNWEATRKYLKELRADESVGKIGMIGYCYGGKMTVLAAIDKLIDCGVLCHPSALSVSEASKVQVPLLFQMAEEDHTFSEKEKEGFLKTLKERGLLDSGSKTYEGTVHGYACRPALWNPKIKEAYEQTMKASVDFFHERLG